MSIVLEIRTDDERVSPTIVSRAELDDATIAWLIEVQESGHIPSLATLIAAIVRDVREDDQAAHDEAIPEGITLQ